MNQIEKSRIVAMIAHAGQKRHDGTTPYHSHPEAVANMVSGAAKPAAWLHHVLEDTKVTANLLRQLSFNRATVQAVLILTKVNGEDYIDYIKDVSSNNIARLVKIADIKHNLSQNHKPENVEKYKKALEILTSP